MTKPRKLPTIAAGSGPRLVRHTGVVACIEAQGDQGEPILFDFAFEGVGEASILIVPQLFETAAPETALVRLVALDVRLIIAPGFEARFYQRCISSGLLALPLADDVVHALAAWAKSSPRPLLTIDLDKQVIEPEGNHGGTRPFEVDPRVRRKLLLGLTDEEEMLEHVGTTTARRIEDRKKRPWLYEPR